MTVVISDIDGAAFFASLTKAKQDAVYYVCEVSEFVVKEELVCNPWVLWIVMKKAPIHYTDALKEGRGAQKEEIQLEEEMFLVKRKTFKNCHWYNGLS